jgi:hypothetical protein
MQQARLSITIEEVIKLECIWISLGEVIHGLKVINLMEFQMDNCKCNFLKEG